MNLRAYTSVVFVLVGLGAGAPLLAGPLDPPAGPIGSTAKPLAEVEPRITIGATNTPGDANSLYRITQPGSYYLTGNITGVSGKHGIEIASNRVTLDLNGFTLTGVAGSLAGITSDGVSRASLHVRNGSVASWGAEGIILDSTSVGSVVENIRTQSNGSTGMYVNSCVVRNCTSVSNTGYGIRGALVVVGCVAHNNTVNGISAMPGSTITGCSSYDNDGDGINASNGASITNCSARNNGGIGIIAFGDSTIIGCSATTNGSHGFSGQAPTAIIDCIAGDNGDDGFVVLTGSLVRGCTARGNASDGIFVSSTSGSRIEGNNMSNNGRGLHVIGAGNVIVRNTASGNTVVNWSIAADNVVGPILNRTAPGSASISGDSAPSSLGSSDANANYTY